MNNLIITVRILALGTAKIYCNSAKWTSAGIHTPSNPSPTTRRWSPSRTLPELLHLFCIRNRLIPAISPNSILEIQNLQELRYHLERQAWPARCADLFAEHPKAEVYRILEDNYCDQRFVDLGLWLPLEAIRAVGISLSKFSIVSRLYSNTSHRDTDRNSQGSEPERSSPYLDPRTRCLRS